MDQSFINALDERILLLDGGLGTLLQTYDLYDDISTSPDDKRGCNDLLSVTRPDIIEDIHLRYLEAGADIISTNSFNANAISLADYGLQDQAYDISKAAAQAARRAIDRYSSVSGKKRAFVAGSVGPTNRTLSMSADINSPGTRDITYKHMYNAYYDQVKGLIDGGADVILVETIFDTLNAKAALSAIRDLSSDIPVMVSATISDASGRTLTGQSIEAFCASVMHAHPVSIGLNCGFGARHLLPYLRRLAAVSAVRVSVHPNAGLPNVSGGYDETPEMFVNDIEQYLREGLVNIVGGCCGTTPQHISALHSIIGAYTPRPLPEQKHICTLSGLDPLQITAESNFINIGERTNVAGSAKFARLIREGNYDEALSIARAQVEAGAQIVDVCMDDSMIDGVAAMSHFLNLMASEPEISRVPVMVDSSGWQVIEAGLEAVQGKGIVNSISLKAGEQAFIEQARKIMNYGAAAVVMLFDEDGQADTYQRKIEVAKRAYDLLIGIGFAPEDIIFDPNILAVATGMPEHDRYAHDFIEATRWIKQNLPYAKVSGGVSNLSFAFRGNNQVRKAMHAVFLYHAIAAGMDMAIVNPQMVQLYDDIEPALLERVEDLILYRREDAAERLIEYAKGLQGETISTDTAKSQQWRQLPVDQRIRHAMIKGDTDYITNDTVEAYEKVGSAVAVIDTILMPAMTHIGALFAEGKMFLPQVVKSARVMKQAVAAIEPYFNTGAAHSGASDSRPIVIATVKGDVHDIGKNIVSVVLSCNGYDVHDLGVMVPPEKIISEAIRLNAAVICLSGLITPSLEEMIRVAREAERQHLDIPIIVGGATTSALHTAVKIAPATNAPVIHSTDAADNAGVIGNLLGPNRDIFLKTIAEKQKSLREEYAKPKPAVTTCQCCGAPIINHEEHIHTDYKQLTILQPKISDIASQINWSYFLAAWGIPGRYPEVLSDPVKGQEAQKLIEDAKTWLIDLAEGHKVRLLGFLQTFEAHVEGDDLILGEHRLPMLRNSKGECITDFVTAGADHATLFALTAGLGASELCESLRQAGDDYSAIMVKLLCDRLVEAFADTVLKGGCRIAIGYPSAPDHTLKRDIFDILEVDSRSDMRLTENFMIVPGESICGIYLPEGHYIDCSEPGSESLNAYASRRGLPVDIIQKSFKGIN